MDTTRRNLILGGVGGGALLLAIVLFLVIPGGQAELPREIRLNGVCLACQQPVSLDVAVDEKEPHECPKCGERAVYQWWFCFECKTRFVPRLVRSQDGTPPAVPYAPTCPVCRSDLCGAWIPDDPDYKPSRDAPLPKWP